MKQELDAALNANDLVALEKLLPRLRPQIISFLQVRFRAAYHDAEDAVSGAVIELLQLSAEGRPVDSAKLVAYLRVASRRILLRHSTRSENILYKPEIFDDDLGDDALVADHLEILIGDERMAALETCIKTLTEESRTFLEDLLRDSTQSVERIAEKFSMTVSSVWARKSRVIKQMHTCVKKKLTE
jgi:RNA polymerase sigma factor (sigma-70 family)